MSLGRTIHRASVGNIDTPWSIIITFRKYVVAKDDSIGNVSQRMDSMTVVEGKVGESSESRQSGMLSHKPTCH
jgi:hypothetical protein